MKYDQIKQIFTDLKELKFNGIWLSGIKVEGEYKSWYANGQLWIHCFYKYNKLNGEYKHWHDNGELYSHKLYKDGKEIKDYLK